MAALATAIKIAVNAHDGQTDKAGKPYILHPLRIMQRLAHESEEVQVVAILHDVVEDTDVTFEELEKLFNKRVITALRFLTHDQDVSYENYIYALSMNEIATKVKLEDLKDNSDITRLKGVTEKDFKRMEKYHKAYTFLSRK